MKRKILTTILALALSIGLFPQTGFAADIDENTKAVEYVTAQKIFVGDSNENLNLESGLTRAELAVILTRLDYLSTPGGLDEWNDWGQKHFAAPENRYNTFTDIPDWAAPYIEYCYQRSLMVGVGDNRFDPQGKVNPQMAATVVLRYCGIRETDWNYQTSVAKAQNAGIAPADGMDGAIILRGTMAVIIYRGIHYADADVVPNEPTEPTPSQPVADATEPSVTMTIDEMKAEIIRLTNIERVKAGVPELEVLPELMDCAQAKAEDMYTTGYVGHNSPTYGTHNEMIKLYVNGVNGGWENLTLGPVSTASGAFNEWMTSESHRATLLDKRTTHIGVGIYVGDDGRYYWVQQFVRLD